MIKANPSIIVQEIEKVLIQLKPIRSIAKGGPSQEVASEYTSHNIALVSSALERYTPINSPYRKSLGKILEQHNLSEYREVLNVSGGSKRSTRSVTC